MPRTGPCVAVFSLIVTVACNSDNRPGTTTPVSPTPSPAPSTLSGRVFELIPGARVHAAGFPVHVGVMVTSSCSPPCLFTRRLHWSSTTSGPDGRFRVSDLPAGPAIVHAVDSATHQQVCGASVELRPGAEPPELEIEVTSTRNPQPATKLPPLRVTGQVYEMTPSGRVGVDGAMVFTEWLVNDSPFVSFYADREGRYTACGIPANTSMAFGVYKMGYQETFRWHQFTGDSTLDIEIRRE